MRKTQHIWKARIHFYSAQLAHTQMKYSNTLQNLFSSTRSLLCQSVRISAPWAQLPIAWWAAASQGGGAADTQGSRGRAVGMLPCPPAAGPRRTLKLMAVPSTWHLHFFMVNGPQLWLSTSHGE